jgi:SAM-dependent methyltransferase
LTGSQGADLKSESFVREQYGSTGRLATRISVWHPDPDGRWPQDVMIELISELKPTRVIDVGCGTGAFAARCAQEVGCEVIGADSSPAMVEATRRLGIAAIEADVQKLPFDDGEFDCVVAAWMLYHVPEIDAALNELHRILRPGGRLLAVTNGRGHIAELWEAVGAEKFETSFNTENGHQQLDRHFRDVRVRKIHTRAVFENREQAASYLDSLGRHDLVDKLPEFSGPFVACGAPAIFIADKG